VLGVRALDEANDQIVEAPNIPEGKVPIKKKDGEM
jgi:hypothetical protein